VPLPVEQITPDTPIERVRALIAKTIQQLTDQEGKDPKAAAGQAYSMAEEQWGRSIPKTR